jgi:hypothetical protein
MPGVDTGPGGMSVPWPAGDLQGDGIVAYHSDKIANVINRLNQTYFLPAIQREFVWQPEQIIRLFDSLMRGYPISSFLFWELQEANRDKWEIYRFIENFRQGGTRNERAGTAGIQQLFLVLDGQQRLTSLLIGLKGSYTIKRKWKRWDTPDAWVRTHLHLDLLKDPRLEEAGGDAGICYGFKFLPKDLKAMENGPEHYWLEVGRILDLDNDNKLADFQATEEDRLDGAITRNQMKVFRQNLAALHRAIWKDDVIASYTETSQDYDRVLDIFIRANEGGTKLSKSDLLLSTVTASWDGVNAREEIHGFVDRLNNDLTRKNAFDKDVVMKSCLVLTDLPVQYKVENFNNRNLQLIQGRWGEIKWAIEAGVNLANSFGIDRDTLTSANALIPIFYYLFQHPRATLLGSTPADLLNASLVRRWLLTVLLDGTFGGQSDNLLRDSRRVLQEHAGKPDFPCEALQREIARSGAANGSVVETVLAATYGRQTTFLALSLLYDENRWGMMPHHQDHIFPRSQFTEKRLREAGIPEERIGTYRGLVDRLGNLQLLLSTENVAKSAQPFEQWLATRDRDFQRRHLIPEDDALLKLDRFEEFITAREALIRQRLDLLFSALDVSGADVAQAEEYELAGLGTPLPLERGFVVSEA